MIQCECRGSARWPLEQAREETMKTNRTIWIVMTIALAALPMGVGARGHGNTEKADMSRATETKRRVIYNLDCTEVAYGTFGPPAPATIDKFADDHAALGVTDLFINVNAQRTNYDSDVWESFWDGYDPDKGSDQPFFDGAGAGKASIVRLISNFYSYHKQGCDYPQRMIDRCRRDKVSPWISIRMNDGHFPDLPKHPIHSKFWQAHPEWWLQFGMDYEQPEVCENMMKLIREVCGRYDVDGIELDYLRFQMYFRPGREHEGAKIMTAFVKDVRKLTNAASKRVGHPVKLAVRVPTTPWIARMYGLEAVEWAKSGLLDLVIASPFWPSINSDIPIEAWKGCLIGTGVPVAFGLEGCMDAGFGPRNSTPDEQRGAMISGIDRGADAIYFFNLFTNPYQFWPRSDYDAVIKAAASYDALAAAPRRHPITITSPWAAGEPGVANRLPYSGTNGAFRIHIGPKPLAQRIARVELVIKENEKPVEVKVNSAECPFKELAEPTYLKTAGVSGDLPKRQVYDIPADAVSEGYNLVEVNSREPVTITWLEISVR